MAGSRECVPTADKRRSPTLGVGQETVFPRRKKKWLVESCYRRRHAYYESNEGEIHGSCGTHVTKYECLQDFLWEA
jgi:hypothetical protein